jgi:hypothetical protein
MTAQRIAGGRSHFLKSLILTALPLRRLKAPINF